MVLWLMLALCPAFAQLPFTNSATLSISFDASVSEAKGYQEA